MLSSHQKIIIIVLIGTSICLSGWSFYRFYENSKYKEILRQNTQIRHAQRFFPVEMLQKTEVIPFSSERFSHFNGDVVAIIVLNPKVCSPCIGEVLDYHQLFTELAGEIPSIQPILLIVGTEPGSAERMLKLTDFDIASFFTYDRKIAQNVGWYGDNRVVLQQIIFVDRKKKIAFYRATMPGQGSSLERKREILSQMLNAYSALMYGSTPAS